MTENIDEGDADKTYLQRAIERIEEAADLVNETIRQHENLLTLLATQEKFGGNLDLFKDNRRLIRHGKVLKVSRKRPEQVMLHLFNDLLLYSDMLSGGGFRLRRTIHLDSDACKVTPKVPPSYAGVIYEGRPLREDCGFTVRWCKFVLFSFVTTSCRFAVVRNHSCCLLPRQRSVKVGHKMSTMQSSALNRQRGKSENFQVSARRMLQLPYGYLIVSRKHVHYVIQRSRSCFGAIIVENVVP